jgi:hypothetical protein
LATGFGAVAPWVLLLLSDRSVLFKAVLVAARRSWAGGDNRRIPENRLCIWHKLAEWFRFVDGSGQFVGTAGLAQPILASMVLSM